MENDDPTEKYFLGCETGNLKLVINALKKGIIASHPSPNPKYIAQGTHALGVASYNGHLNVVKYLLTSVNLKKYPEPNRELYTPEGQEPMVLAFKNNHLKVVDFFLEQIVQKYRDGGFYYPEYFDFAFTEKQNDLAKYLIGSTNLLKELSPKLILKCACRTDNVELFKYLLKSKDLEENAQIDKESLDWAFRKNSTKIINTVLNAPRLAESPKTVRLLLELACKHNNLDLLAHLVNTPQLQQHADMDLALCLYCLKNKGDKSLQYTRELFSSRFSKNPDPNCYNGTPLSNSCNMGNFDLVKFLTQSPSLQVHANPNNTQAVANSCAKGDWDIVEYLLKSPEIKEHPNVLEDPDKIFKAAFNTFASIERNKFIKFLIFELKIEKSPAIIECLAQKFDARIDEMFKQRDAQQLELELHHKTDVTNYKSNKTKI